MSRWRGLRGKRKDPSGLIGKTPVWLAPSFKMDKFFSALGLNTVRVKWVGGGQFWADQLSVLLIY